MKKNNEIFDEQNAPLKNTDAAFVRVSTDGRPEMPDPDEIAGRKEKGINNSDEQKAENND